MKSKECVIMYIAHFDHKKIKQPHYLKEHVEGMLRIVNDFDLNFDYYNIIKSAVILHDVGKKSSTFQEYVKSQDKRRGSIQHAIGGAFALSQQTYERLEDETRIISEFIQLIVASHHTGLKNYDKSFFDKLKRDQLPTELQNIDKLAQEEVKEVLSIIDGKHCSKVLKTYGEDKFRIYLSLLVRFAMSALIDADYLDTEAYFSKETAKLRVYKTKDFVYFQERLEQYLSKKFKSIEGNDLYEIRERVQQLACKSGAKNYTFYTLHSPTGTGKTIAALKFALQHAIKYKKRRIITALPLINLTEEISELYKCIFGLDYIVEDHSGITVKDANDKVRRLASENWDRPFVVTTTVQLFESIFHHKPSKLRKIHRLENSIIIIDEYHQLPLHVLKPILQVLDILQTHFNVTVLCISATPFPLLESKKIKKLNLTHKPMEIISDKKIFRKMPSRIDYKFIDKQLSFEELASKLARHSSVLTIVNTRKQAQELFLLFEKSNHSFDSIFHLSTTMCSYHRKKVINKIKTSLNKEKNIAVISTSIMEVGIDISFPVVYRMLAPLDSIVQAAGRSNRDNKLYKGKVILFKLKNNILYDKYLQAGISQVESLIYNYGMDHFTTEESFINYYKRIFSNCDLNEQNIFVDNNHLNFKDISMDFKMIQDERISVLCTKAPGFNKEWLKDSQSRKWWRKIKQFMVPVPKQSNTYKIVNNIPIWTGEYDEKIGVIL